MNKTVKSRFNNIESVPQMILEKNELLTHSLDKVKIGKPCMDCTPAREECEFKKKNENKGGNRELIEMK